MGDLIDITKRIEEKKIREGWPLFSFIKLNHEQIFKQMQEITNKLFVRVGLTPEEANDK